MSSTTFKPWGFYIDLYRTDELVYKIINVDPNKKLSLQSHSDRTEEWVLINGNGSLQLEDQIIKLETNVIYTIPQNSKHRLINNDPNCLLTIFEKQYGICKENDIVRYEDDYGRC